MTHRPTAPRNAAARPPQRRSSPKPPKPRQDASAVTLSAWKARYGIVTHKFQMHPDCGNGRRHQFMCYRRLVPLRDGGSAKFIELMHEYSVAALLERGHCADGEDARDACARLAERNGWPKP